MKVSVNRVTLLSRKDIKVDVIFKPTNQNGMSAIEIILKHKELADRYDSSWLGTDQNFSEVKIRDIDKNGHDIRVLFVNNETKDREHRVIYSAELIDIITYKSGERGGVRYDNNLIPLYYVFDEKRCWLKLKNFKKLREDEINIKEYKLLFREDEARIEGALKNGQCCLMYAYTDIV